ncbi:3-hydroxybutyryl-CoA dehydrogenase [Mycolicibacterium chitae]|uniref:3-hydroxybutyryl-CoA dehydrogenase n=1 Tax=Mycolicibacterium TaxID=1866885 RepID=UPI000F82A7FE|nr:3-hydroxybutyryl-CoA dehydrogenase [Mycolicibacterium chitae]MCV7108103.1 3-hydroxybutyryl-CoA dehydrogenase [Mycolicibacterium chitae]BBZ04510.1 3-hydroxybutyryl-CoA dehydrogenase [Mycolicibacterium chitae]
METAVGVIGGGIMGCGIAEVAARSGCNVVLREVNQELVQAAERKLEVSLGTAVRKAKLSQTECDEIRGRIRFTDSMAEMADRDLVVEAVIESLPVKTEIFGQLGKIARPDALLATNTSSIPIMQVAAATERPERVVGLHFFNPAPVMPLVEIIACEVTSDETLRRAREFAADQLGKTTIRAKDRAGFVVNALLIPYLLSAIRMAEAGLASVEDIDQGMVGGCGHPMGPLALTDLIGLDTTMAVAESMYAETKERLYAPPALLMRKVEAGELGRKSGRGFFTYPKK